MLLTDELMLMKFMSPLCFRPVIAEVTVVGPALQGAVGLNEVLCVRH